jgi:hypothetical protein
VTPQEYVLSKLLPEDARVMRELWFRRPPDAVEVTAVIQGMVGTARAMEAHGWRREGDDDE